MFADKLIKAVREKNPICVGLDPNMDYMPKHLKNNYSTTNAISKFNEEIIEAIYDLVPIVKPQIAYYEQFGVAGMEALKLTIEYAKEKGLLVIMDAKRNDISSTADAYADAYLKPGADFESDALTVTPYLGIDGISPFIKRCEDYGKGIFILLKTSNPSSSDLQDLLIEKDRPLYSHMADLIADWGAHLIGESGYSSVGAVVGATHPKEAATLRKQLSQQFFLVPGYGAQGGTAEDVVPCFNSYKEGAIVNSSRGIIYAYKKLKTPEKKFAEAARLAVINMKKNLDLVLK